MIADFATDDAVQLTRYVAGAYETTHGRYVAGSSSTTTIVASVQTPTAEQLLQLAEGQRTEDTIAVYTATKLQTAATPAGVKADRLTYQSKTYEVQKLFDWSMNGNFVSALCVRVAA